MLTLPGKLPAAHQSAPGVSSISDQDVGGYDFMIGGHGFRLATDQQFAYIRGTEPTTTHRFDSSLEPGEQSLSPLPWIKSQSSFHAGAGQLNLEQGFTAFQYQQEQVEHIRFDACQGVDIWTPGQVTRLPDTRFFNFGFDCQASITATIGGVDYAIIGGAGGLFQVAWLAGPDADPTVTRISMANSTYLSDANCTITSLCTDGANYYGVVQLNTVSWAGDMTFIFAGRVDSTATPEAIYKVPNLTQGTTLFNLVTNPSFEVDASGWTGVSWFGVGGGSATVVRSTTRAKSGTASGLLTITAGTSYTGTKFNITGLTPGNAYTFSIWVYVPTGGAYPLYAGAQTYDTYPGSATEWWGTATTVKDAWQRIETTFIAGASGVVNVGVASPGNVGGTAYLDAAMLQVGSWTFGDYFDGNTPNTAQYKYTWQGTANASVSKATPIFTPAQTPGIVGWQKARLVGLIGRSMYELDANAAVGSDLPDPKYTHPSTLWNWTAITESPTGILAAGSAGNQASILEFSLDSSGGTPMLSGGSSIAILPVGEQIQAMEQVLGAWLALGTSEGVRVGTFDTYTGNLKLGPLSVTTTAPVYDVCTRDRFVYGGYTNQQPDGKTGLVRLDLSMVTDVAGRLAYAPDLRPPTTAPTGLGTVKSVNILPTSGRILFITPEGFHVEGHGPGTNGNAWIRTSRIRYDTAEMKLFKLGRVHGALDVANIEIVGIGPYGYSKNLGTFGYFDNQDPGEFRLIDGINEWIQLEFHLLGSGAVLNSYQVKAYPAPQRQHIIELTANCFTNEVDRFGLEVTDPETPRQRLQNVVDLEAIGNETRLVEFTNFGPVAQLVLIDQIEFKSFSRPNTEDDFGGYITFRLRTTEN